MMIRHWRQWLQLPMFTIYHIYLLNNFWNDLYAVRSTDNIKRPVLFQVLGESCGTIMQHPLPKLFIVLQYISFSLGLYHICYYHRTTEWCAIGDFDPPVLELPDNICAVEQCPEHQTCLMCSDCPVVNWVTFAQHKGTLYAPTHFISQPHFETNGTHAAYDCTRRLDDDRRRQAEVCKLSWDAALPRRRSIL